MKKYDHPLTKDLTPSNWQDKLDLNALSLDDLVTIWGDLKSMESFAKKVGGYLREVINAKLPPDQNEYDGSVYHLERTERYRAGGLDKELITEEMGEEWVEAHLKEGTEYTEIRIKRKVEEE